MHLQDSGPASAVRQAHEQQACGQPARQGGGRPAPALDAASLVAGGVERHGQARRGGGGRREVERHQQRVAAGAPQRPPRQLAQLQRERRRPPPRGQRPRLRLQRRRPRQVVRRDAGPAAAQPRPESCFVTARDPKTLKPRHPRPRCEGRVGSDQVNQRHHAKRGFDAVQHRLRSGSLSRRKLSQQT